MMTFMRLMMIHLFRIIHQQLHMGTMDAAFLTAFNRKNNMRNTRMIHDIQKCILICQFSERPISISPEALI